MCITRKRWHGALLSAIYSIVILYRERLICSSKRKYRTDSAAVQSRHRKLALTAPSACAVTGTWEEATRQNTKLSTFHADNYILRVPHRCAGGTWLKPDPEEVEIGRGHYPCTLSRKFILSPSRRTTATSFLDSLSFPLLLRIYLIGKYQ